MGENYYMINMQKLLHIVKELHIRGFEKLRIIPSLSPSGLSWRCSFLADTDSERKTIITSGWIQDIVNIEQKIDYSIVELTDMFIEDHVDFLNLCKGKNMEYVEWYIVMLNNLKQGELPYAFSDYFGPTDYWETSEGQNIPTLPNEKRYYINS
jgi:hypothetical protein